jgi:hypothetical protein
MQNERNKGQTICKEEGEGQLRKKAKAASLSEQINELMN